MTEHAGRYYFMADLHLGPDTDPGREREQALADYLRALPSDARGVFLLGDIFDFWVDYKDVVPRGSVRLLSALAEVAARTDVWFFRGNHDWWVTDYFEKELGVHIVREPYRIFDLGGRRVLIGHGDTLGAHDAKAKLIFHVFRNRVCIALLKCLPPRWVFGFARRWAAHSRKRHAAPYAFRGKESPLYKFVDSYGQANPPADLYLFGHLHTPGSVAVESGGTLRVLPAWSGPADTFVL